MPFNLRIPVLATLTGAFVIYVIFLMPPLTSGSSGPSSPGKTDAEVEALRAAEREFCLQQPEAVDCQCFAKRSGVVLSHKEAQVVGAVYADKKQLARGQAMNSC